MYFLIQNDGTAENTVFVQGSPVPQKSTLRYFLGTTDSEITSVVQSGTYQTLLPAGGSVLIRAEIFVPARAKVASMNFSLTAKWTGDSVLQDTAGVAVTLN